MNKYTFELKEFIILAHSIFLTKLNPQIYNIKSKLIKKK